MCSDHSRNGLKIRLGGSLTKLRLWSLKLNLDNDVIIFLFLCHLGPFCTFGYGFSNFKFEINM